MQSKQPQSKQNANVYDQNPSMVINASESRESILTGAGPLRGQRLSIR